MRWVYRFFFFGITIGTLAYLAPIYVDWKNNTVRSDRPVKTETALSLHQSLTIVDLHADSLLWSRSIAKANRYGHVDLPKLRKGNIAIQVFSAVTKSPSNLNVHRNSDETANITLLAIANRWPKKTWRSLLQRALHQSERLHKLADDQSNHFSVIRDRDDLDRFLKLRQRDSSYVAGILSLEGAHALEGNIQHVQTLYDAGYRIIGLTHFFDNELGGSAHGIEKGGLTDFGKKVIEQMQALDMTIDLAHASPQLLQDVLEFTKAPVLVSHTGVNAICSNALRNLSNSQIQRIADNGGIIGVGFWPGATCSQNITGIIDTILGLREIVGIEYIALGSDFDGYVQTPIDASGVSAITLGLLEAGLSEQEVAQVMGLNTVRFLKRALPE